MRIIGGTLGGRIIKVPNDFKSRPTTDLAREALFNILSNRYDFDELTVLDLFSGTGSILYEFYSRGTTKITGVEINPRYVSFIKKNFETFDIQGVQIFCTDSLKYIKRAPKEHFDLIFYDPPFDFKDRQTIIDQIFDNNILKPNGVAICEHSPNDNYSQNPYFTEARHYGKVNFSFFSKEYR
ncbi:MAG TPA: 16S rRNA (guanine(966)-N(2))-methyltransferase RsmD [Salinivirgaceae bacterium]|nr:16S rRNA (guanine(966)-N(2))-methyltransferase RsmD [Salinivirgaceae bacterium]